MSSAWTLILEDGTRSPATAHVRFEVLGGQKLLVGALELTPDVFEAFNQGTCILESSSGHRHKVVIEKIAGAEALIRGTI